MPQELHPPKVKIVTGPPEGGILREAWARVKLPFAAVRWRLRTWWLLHRGITHARRWWNPFWHTVGIFALWGLALALVAWTVRGLLIAFFFNGENDSPPGWLGPWGFDPDEACRRVGTSCGAVTGVVMPVLLLATSTLVFLAWRLWRVRRFATRQARTQPSRFVQTAGSLMDEVVGRDQLCNAIMNNLRDRRARRPHVVVGNVGAGKTAVLVRLAEKLAAKGAVPVPVRLRDAQEKLDFRDLAYDRFSNIVLPKVRSSAEADRMWQWLRQRADKIVVLADGLEEALNHPSVRGQRDDLIREAIRRADADGLPLVIASRPHDPLRGMQAAISELEPLSVEAALQYIARGGTWRSDPTLLDRVVEVANMAESPLYLQIAKDLHSKDLLEPLWTGDGTEPMLHDSWALRADLLKHWVYALVDGDVHPELPIDRDTRQAVVEYISALACIGLASDHANVELPELAPPVDTGQDGGPGNGDKKPRPTSNNSNKWNRRVAQNLDNRMDKLWWTPNLPKPDCGKTASSPPPSGGQQRGSQDGEGQKEGPRIDVRLAATWGTRMGLVEQDGEKVRFQHSIMQAYLGSRFLPEVLVSESPAAGSSAETQSRSGEKKPEHPLTAALRKGGRELLIALTLYSRSGNGQKPLCKCGDRSMDNPEPCPIIIMRELLMTEAKGQLEKAEKADRASHPWEKADSSTLEVLDDRGSPRLRALEIYGAAVEIDSLESDPGHHNLIQEVSEGWKRLGRGEDPARLREAKLTLVRQCGATARRLAADHGRAYNCRAYQYLAEIGPRESDYRVRAGIVKEVGAGGEPAYRALCACLANPRRVVDVKRSCHKSQPEQPNSDGAQEELREKERAEQRAAEREALLEKENWYCNTMGAWLLPLLVDSAMMSRHLASPRDDLEKWVSVAAQETRAGSPTRNDPAGAADGLGVALAQGFKYAANRRLGPQSDRQAREFLVKHAEELLKRSTFWYTRLTLLHALTLWALPDDVNADQPIRGHGADPKGQVQEWLTLDDGQKEHPLVTAAGKLAVCALQSRRPERFLWIDEASVASAVGTEVGLPGEQRAHNLWIPPSTGWSTLDPTAQQLLADVLLLMVLGERGYRPKDLFRILDHCSRERTQIPSCMKRDRTRLDPVRGAEHTLQPGSNCTDECRLRMCPYPAKVENLRVEFSEVFCLHQRDLLRIWQPLAWIYLRFRREAPWQRKVPVAGMRRFWDQMASRARDAKPDGADTTRRRIRS